MNEIQSIYWIKQDHIIGFIIGEKHRRWKECKWCGNTFNPHHNKQSYCDKVCQSLSRQKYKSNWMYRNRIRQRNGDLFDDRSILNVGTGGLGEHCEVDNVVEHRKIIGELRRLGLRR